MHRGKEKKNQKKKKRVRSKQKFIILAQDNIINLTVSKPARMRWIAKGKRRSHKERKKNQKKKETKKNKSSESGAANGALFIIIGGK